MTIQADTSTRARAGTGDGYQIEAHDLGIQDSNRLLEQFLTGLVALENRDHQRLGHRRLTIPAGRGVNLRAGDAHGALQLVR